MIDPHNFKYADYVDWFGSGNHCAANAVALHKLTGWPIYRLWNPEELPIGHAVVKSPIGFFDLGGLLGPDEYKCSKPVSCYEMEESRVYVEGLIQEELEAVESDRPLNIWDGNCVSEIHLERMAKSDASLELSMVAAEVVLKAWFPNFRYTEPAVQLELLEDWEPYPF